MTWFTSFRRWFWTLLAMCGGVTSAFIFAASGADARVPSKAAAAVPIRDVPEYAIVIAKHTRHKRPAAAHAAAAAPAPAPAPIVTVSSNASVAHAQKAVAPSPAPAAKTVAPSTPVATRPRASSNDVEEATNVLLRAQGESTL
jgi:hypothetical protein